MNICVFTKNPGIACSYYRGLGVIPVLPKIDPSINVTISDSVPLFQQAKEAWYAFGSADIVYVERPANPEYYSACLIAKNANHKLWIDFDDDFINIPETNPYAKTFLRDDNQQSVRESCKMADIITVATDELRDVYRKFNKNVHVIPNAFNDYRYKWEYSLSDKKSINWRGSVTHRHDLLPVVDNIWKLAGDNPDWLFTFIGNEVWYIADGMRPGEGIRNKKIFPELKNEFFWKCLKEICPSIQYVPLADVPFNRAKSCCSWIEGTYAGAVCVVPDFGDFKKPGCVNYNGDFSEKIQALMDDPKLRKQKYDESFDYIRDNLLLSVVNKRRLEIANGLMS